MDTVSDSDLLSNLVAEADSEMSIVSDSDLLID
jgi:hypothetical protein